MVQVATIVGALLSVAASVSATKVNFINKCSDNVQLYHSQELQKLEKLSDIAAGETYTRDVTGPAHMFRDGFDTDATLVEFSMPKDNKAWYDISVIPPMPGHCRSFDDCKQVTGKRGFNRAVTMEPLVNANGKNCRTLVCAADDKVKCADAYHFPDDIKTHDCPASTEFNVVFCPDGSASAPAPAPAATKKDKSNNNNYNNNNNNNNQQQQQQQQQSSSYSAGKVSAYESGTLQKDAAAPAPAGNSDAYANKATAAPAPAGNSDAYANEASSAPTVGAAKTAGSTKLGNVRATYSYKGKQAGNIPGTYNRVTKLSGCVKEQVSVNSPVGPLSEEVGIVFRGPMEIYNIAVFSGESHGNGTFSRVSSYARDSGATENLMFMNNKNVDYSGGGKHGPQGFSTEDGLQKADAPKVLKGVLAEATNPSQKGAGPGIETGAEVNIMTGKSCKDGGCLGYHGDNDYHGWGGDKKLFVTKVKMPQGKSPNQPALWMLNAQVLHSNQYGCNCRGVGSVGGCGELDIAEVIETNDKRDKVTTHYYFYDGSVLSPGGDNFAARPVDAPTVYLTLIDAANGGLIKIIQVDDFDFSQGEITQELYQQMLQA